MAELPEGKFLAANQDGAYVIRLEGDVRVTLATTIDDYFEKMYADPQFASVWVDLCAAEGIDSTTLGLLAKLALTVKQKFGFLPAIYSRDPGINRLINSMGFKLLFELHEDSCSDPEAVDTVPVVSGSEASIKQKVIEAHRVLMGISPANRARFKDLMSALERS